MLKVLHAGGAPAQSWRLRRQRLHLVMCACKQSPATLVLHATAKTILWPTPPFYWRFIVIL